MDSNYTAKRRKETGTPSTDKRIINEGARTTMENIPVPKPAPPPKKKD